MSVLTKHLTLSRSNITRHDLLNFPNFGAFFIQSKRTAFYDHWIKFDRWQDRVGLLRKEARISQQLKHWLPHPKNSPFRPVYVLPERQELDLPQKPLDEKVREEQGCMSFDATQRIHMLRYLDWGNENMARKQRYDRLIELQYDQRLIPERQMLLGPDLAAAHFLVNRGAAIKFVGDEEWHQMNKKQEYILPARRIDGLFLEAMDASRTELMFEAFDHLTPLKKLRFASFVDCKFMSDWCLSRFNQFETSLEYLDLSQCKRVSAKGLSSLACLKKLKYLRVDGLNHLRHIGEVCAMLEDKLPDLTIIGVDYEKAALDAERRLQLLDHPNVVEDVRGNIFLIDNVGETYYLDGDYQERPVVDEDDLPIIHSRIRPDPPALPLADLELLDKLTNGKLSHTLAGSPSGLNRAIETKRIFEIDQQRLTKKNIPVHPFLACSDQSIIDESKIELLEALGNVDESKYALDFKEADDKLLLGVAKSG